MVLEDAIQRLELLRDNLFDLTLHFLERGAISLLSVTIGKIQLHNKLGRDYSEKYKAYRIEKGRQVAYVDLTLTGDMFRGMQIVEVNESENAIELHVGFTREIDFRKYVDNVGRFGQFMHPDAEDIENMRADIIEDISNEIKRILK